MTAEAAKRPSLQPSPRKRGEGVGSRSRKKAADNTEQRELTAK